MKIKFTKPDQHDIVCTLPKLTDGMIQVTLSIPLAVAQKVTGQTILDLITAALRTQPYFQRKISPPPDRRPERRPVMPFDPIFNSPNHG